MVVPVISKGAKDTFCVVIIELIVCVSPFVPRIAIVRTFYMPMVNSRGNVIVTANTCLAPAPFFAHLRLTRLSLLTFLV